MKETRIEKLVEASMNIWVWFVMPLILLEGFAALLAGLLIVWVGLLWFSGIPFDLERMQTLIDWLAYGFMSLVGLVFGPLAVILFVIGTCLDILKRILTNA